MASQTTKLSISPREPEGSRATRRLRRSGRVPGVLYGGDAEPLPFSVDARELRHALAAAGAVLEVSDGGSADAGGPQERPVPPGARRDDARRPAAREPQRRDPRRRAARAHRRRRLARRQGGRRARADHARAEHRGAADRRSPSRSPTTCRRWRSTTRSRSPSVTVPAGVTLLDDVEETTVATLTPPRVETEERRDRGRDRRRRRGRRPARPRRRRRRRRRRR